MPQDISDMNFEDAYAELTSIIDQLESGDLKLEESVTLYERGQQLSAHCEQLLDAADLRVRQLNEDGTLSDLG
ncbi:MAG: exodeoxyribonuclease VII small subunit [Chloroflexota bacterium]